MRRRTWCAVAAALSLVACSAETEAPVVIDSGVSEPLTETPVTDDIEPPDPIGDTLIDEDFSDGPGVFFTDAGTDFEVSVGEGVLELFVAGRGAADPNIVRERVELPSTQHALSVEATVEVVGTEGAGFGGYGLRCYSGDDYYLFFVDVARRDAAAPQLSIVRSAGDDFRVVASARQPASLTADPRSRIRAECQQPLVGGSTRLELLVDGRQIITADDPAGLGDAFDGVAVGGEWTGPRIGPTPLSGGRGGGLTFTVDDVVVRPL